MSNNTDKDVAFIQALAAVQYMKVFQAEINWDFTLRRSFV